MISTVIDALLFRPETRHRVSVAGLRAHLTSHVRRTRSRHRVDLTPLYELLLRSDLDEVTAANATLDARLRLKTQLGVAGLVPPHVEARLMTEKRRPTRAPPARERVPVGTRSDPPPPASHAGLLFVAASLLSVVAGALVALFV